MNKVSKALQQAQRDRAAVAPAPTPVASQPSAQAPGAPAVPPPVVPLRLESRAVPLPTVTPVPLPTVTPGRRSVGRPAPTDARVDGHLVSILEPISFAAEQYRTLRHVVEQAHRVEHLSVFAVSAPASGDGKTTTAINLAGALGQGSGLRVLLIDADLRRPSVAHRLGLGVNVRGLVDAIVDPTVTLDDVVLTRTSFNLAVLPAGPPTASPYELLKSPKLAQIFADARQQFDYVVVDTPPLVPVPDCRIIGSYVDGFLVVVAAHRTRAKLFDDAMRVIDSTKVRGIVFNGADNADPGDYYDGYIAHSPDGAATNGGALGRLRRSWTKPH